MNYKRFGTWEFKSNPERKTLTITKLIWTPKYKNVQKFEYWLPIKGELVESLYKKQ